jgi:fructoselysine 6-kinase
VTRTVCFGDNTIDRYLRPVGRDLVGGSCVNVAVGLRRSCIAASYVGPVGDDPAGAQVLTEIAAHGVDTSYVAVVPGVSTAVTEIVLLPRGERRFVSELYEIFDSYQPNADAWASVTSASNVHTSRLSHLFDRLRAAARKDGFSLSCDFSTSEPPPDLDGLDLAFRSAGESRDAEHAITLAAAALERGAVSAVVTLGEAGSVALTADGSTWQDAVEVESVVDTCGAGDAFIAGYLGRWLKGAAIADCLAAGAEAGARACTMVGAFPQAGARAESSR